MLFIFSELTFYAHQISQEDLGRLECKSGYQHFWALASVLCPKQQKLYVCLLFAVD